MRTLRLRILRAQAQSLLAPGPTRTPRVGPWPCYHPVLMWFIELIQDFWYFLRERKAWWMTPIIVVLLLLVVLILVGEKAAVLPFIYTLF